MAYCPSCGRECDALALECPSCNASFEAANGWKPLENPPPSRTEHGLLRVGIALLSLPVLGLLLLGFSELITGKGSGLAFLFLVVPVAIPAAAVGAGFILVYAVKKFGRRRKQ